MPDQVKVRPVGSGPGGTVAAEVLQGQAVAFDGIVFDVSVRLGRVVLPHWFFHQL